MIRRQRLTLFAAFAAAIVLAMVLLGWNRSKEPIYQDKPLSYWMLANARRVNKDQPDPAAALSAIGSNAVPYLLKWAQQRPYNWQKQLRPYREKNAILRRIIPYWATGIDKQNRALAAWEAIPRLGPAGRSAIPRLTVLANDHNDNSVAHLATTALAALEAIPALITVATNQQVKARGSAILYLGQLRNAAAVPALLQCLEELNSSVSWEAVRALGLIHQEQGVVVPALVRALRRVPNIPSRAVIGQRDIRFHLAWAIAEFGTNADSAVPELLRHLSLLDQRDSLSCQFVSTLCRVSAQPDILLPALTTCLQSTNESLRQCTIFSLSSMGPRARFALESLTNALRFPETDRFVTDTIRRITSEAP